MPRNKEKFDETENNKFALLREEGTQKLDDCLLKQIQDLSTLDRIASLAETGRLHLFYETIGEARLEGHSWRSISNAATGKNDYKDGQTMNLNYLSFCKNNNIQPVKIRKSSK